MPACQSPPPLFYVSPTLHRAHPSLPLFMWFSLQLQYNVELEAFAKLVLVMSNFCHVDN